MVTRRRLERALLEQTDSSPLDLANVALGVLDAHLRPQVTVTSVGVERRSVMSRTTFMQWSALAAMFGSVLLALGFVAETLLIYGSTGYAGESLAASAAMLAGAVLILIGIVGFGFAYARRIGGLDQGGLLLALLGLSSFTLGLLSPVMTNVGQDLSAWPAMIFFGHVVMCMGMALFAIVGLRQHVLAIPAALLLLVGGAGAAIGHILLILSFLAHPSDMDAAVLASRTGFVSGTVLYLVGFFLAGSGLWSDNGTAVRPLEHPAAG
jgi:hypothetical protein